MVLGRNDDVTWESVADAGAIVLRCDLPCILVPLGRNCTPQFRCAAVAWNRTAEALRAIHAALPLLRGARLVLMEGRRREPLGGVHLSPEFEISDYLSRHGMRVDRIEVRTEQAAAGEALLGIAGDCGADLLVMGAYGRARFSEWMLGGATRHVLQHATLPVLMRH
jgi:hypothetical protein